MTEGLTRSALRKLENAGSFPLVALQAIRELRPDLEERENQAILRAREMGASLEDIAEAMGLTRQGVSYRIKQLAGNGDRHESDVVDLAAEESDRPRIP
jgi:hypothetical protein